MFAAPLYIIAAVSRDPVKPRAFFAGWGPARAVSAALYTDDRAKARRFDAADEAAIEATLLAPSWPSRELRVIATPRRPVEAR